MEELFLGALLTGDKLDVVHEKHINGVETITEADHAIEAQGVDDFNGKFFGAHVAQAHGRIALLDGVPDGVHQVGLAHAHAAVEEERVISFGRLLGDRARGCMGKLIGFADDKGVEGIARVQLMIATFKIQLGLLGAVDGGSGLDGFFLGADVLHFHLRGTHLVKDGFYNFTVGAGEHLAEDGTGNLDIQGVPFRAVEPGRLKPGGVGIDANPGFDQIEELIPEILHFFFTSNLGSCRHQKMPNLDHFHRCEKTVES